MFLLIKMGLFFYEILEIFSSLRFLKEDFEGLSM
jgi:hypothetical protein